MNDDPAIIEYEKGGCIWYYCAFPRHFLLLLLCRVCQTNHPSSTIQTQNQKAKTQTSTVGTMMGIFNENKQFNPYGSISNHNNGYFIPQEQYSTEKKIEIAAMIEKYGVLASSASKTCMVQKIAQEGEVPLCFVDKICNRLSLARHKSQRLGRGTHSLSEADEHCLVYLYRQHPFRDVQSYVDNLYLITGTLAHASCIFHFFQPLRVFVPSFSAPGSSAHLPNAQDENHLPLHHQCDEKMMEPDELVLPSKSVPQKMPDLSMFSSFNRCGIAPSCSNNKRTLPEDCDRPRVRRRLEVSSEGSCWDDQESLSNQQPVTTCTSLVVYQPPCFSGGMIVSKTKKKPSSSSLDSQWSFVPAECIGPPSVWVPRPPPAEYHGNPQVS